MHSRILVPIAVAGLLGIQLFAVSAVAEETRVRDLAGFDRIEVSGAVDLTILQRSDYLVEVSGPGESLDQLITEVHGDTLKISHLPPTRRWFVFQTYEDFSVEVSLPQLRGLVASGGVDVSTQGRLQAERVEISASGGSDLRLEIDATDLQVSTSGGSDTVLIGTGSRLDARSSGGSDLDATRLQVREASVRSSGGSDVEIDVTERLTARASGGSDIRYSGDPQFVDADSSGGADIEPR